MFDLGMSELLVIGVVALIVISPKDLPQLFRSLGKFTAKMRAMAREFSRAMEAAADETGVKDVAKDLRDATSAKSMGLDKVREAAEKFEKWDPMKNAARPTAPKPAPDPAEDKPRGPTRPPPPSPCPRAALPRRRWPKNRRPARQPRKRRLICCANPPMRRRRQRPLLNPRRRMPDEQRRDRRQLCPAG